MFRRCAFPWTYVESLVAGRLHRNDYCDVDSFVLFIGPHCSGTELVRTLLNADSRISVSTDVSAIQSIRHGYSRAQLFWLLTDSVSRPDFREAKQKLRAIGDGNANKTTQLLRRAPNAFRLLKHRIGVPVRTLHIVSDPFDAIASIYSQSRMTSLRRIVADYFVACETTQRWTESNDGTKTVHVSDLTSSPRATLSDLVRHLSLEPHPRHLSACERYMVTTYADSLSATPSTLPQIAQWPDELADLISQRMDQYRFLRDYSESQPSGIARAA